MSKARTLTALAGATLLLGAAAGVVGTGTAGADPGDPPSHPPYLTVYQIPATALAVSGLLVPGPYFASVEVIGPSEGGDPDVVSIKAPASDEVCATSAGRAHVTVDWYNLTSGASGSETVKPCPFVPGPGSTYAEPATGPGPVVMTVRVVGTDDDPGAGQPSLPGVAAFTVP